MCATGCVSVATNRYLLMSGGGLALSEQEGCIAHLVWCYYESLVWYSSCLMPFDDHVALCDPVSLFVSGSAGCETVSLLAVIGFGSFYKQLPSTFGASLMVAVRFSRQKRVCAILMLTYVF